MNDDEYITREELHIEGDRLLKALRFSQVKVLIEMLVATVVIAFWWPSFGIQYEGPFYRNLMMIMPPLVNSLSWLCWIALAYVSYLRSGSMSGGHGAPREILEQYDRIQYSLRRQKRTEFLFDVLVGLQFLFVGILPLFAMSRWLVP